MKKISLVLALLVAVGTLGCSSTDDGGGTGAASGSSAGAGGVPGAGGSPGAGGMPGAGGAPSAGGSPGTGGTAGVAGVAGTGGTAGTGGAGGTAADASGPVRLLVNGTFFEDLTVGVVPTDLNGQSTVSVKMTTFSGAVLSYNPDTQVTFSVKSNPNNVGVRFESQAPNSDAIAGNPLTVTARDALTVYVQQTQ